MDVVAKEWAQIKFSVYVVNSAVTRNAPVYVLCKELSTSAVQDVAKQMYHLKRMSLTWEEVCCRKSKNSATWGICWTPRQEWR